MSPSSTSKPPISVFTPLRHICEKLSCLRCRPDRIKPANYGSARKMSGSCCGSNGFSGPLEAMRGPEEKVLYVLCLQSPENEQTKCGYIATIDRDPSSSTYSQVIHRLYTQDPQDELHHFGWNSCVSCKNPSIMRRYLIVPGIRTGNIYIVDTIEPTKPSIFKTISGSEIQSKYNISYPHTVHCIPSGEVMISYMGDDKLNAKGAFLLLDGETFQPTRMWNQDVVNFGYDFWYQPRHNIMISSEFGAPASFMTGFDIEHVKTGLYGTKLHFWDWEKRSLVKSIDLGEEGAIPLETRFLHNPDATDGFVGCALGSTVFRIHKDQNGEWTATKVIAVPPKIVEGWVFPAMPSLITDILISLDDKFLYFANFVHGDIRQYNISNPAEPKLVSQVFLGGSICKGESVKVISDPELSEQPERPTVKGTLLPGAPNMLQLSRDGKRLYATFSLVTPWDAQFYPEVVKKGSGMVLLDCTEDGMTLNQDFFVNLAAEPDGAIRGHETRYPGGDCSSDIWV